MKIPIIPPWVKLVGILAVVLAIAASGWYIKGIIADNKQMKSDLKDFKDALTIEQDKNAKQDQIFVKRDELHQDIRNGVADVTVRIKQEATNDPKTRSFNDTVLPDCLRRAIIEANAAAAQCKGANCPHPN
jgi:hypothetical protein